MRYLSIHPLQLGCGLDEIRSIAEIASGENFERLHDFSGFEDDKI